MYSNCVAAKARQDDPLPTMDFAAASLDAALITNMIDQVAQRKDHKLHSILVARHGHLIVEHYYNGYDRHTTHDLRSATKSITSLLTGIAVDRGLLTIEDPMMGYLAREYPRVSDKRDISVRHLLTMSAGLDCDDQDRSSKGQEDRMYRKRDWVAYFLALKAVRLPGEQTSYCTGGVVALGEVLDVATSGFEAFADKALFEPLGIRNYRWATFDRGSKLDTGGHIELTPQAMIKLGMLVSGGGRWGHRQLVSAAWLHAAMSQQATLHGVSYGYLWWLIPAKYPDKEVTVLVARGNGGQTIFVVPEYDLVAAFTTGYFNSPKAQIPFQLFYNAVLLAVLEVQEFVPGLTSHIHKMEELGSGSNLQM
ncbi:MAG: serine hydrolase [Proteobacteria bacterium]|nr:serine hydrolase [Pseudomonadota bacterium]